MMKKVFPILALAMFASMLGVGIITPFLPLYSESMGASGLWIGIIFSAFSISRIMIMPFTGRLSDRRGRKMFLFIGLFSYALISLGYIWADSIPLLLIIRLAQGAASGMILPIAMACIGDLSPKGEEGKWMGYANAAFFSGFGLGPLLGGLIANYFGMDTSFIVMASLNMMASLLILFLLPEIRHREVTTEPRLSFKEMSKSPVIRALFSYRIAYAVGRGTFMSFLSIFASSSLGLGTTDIGILLTTHVLLVSIFQPYLGHIADRFSRRGMVIVGNIINLAFLALIPITQNFWQLLGLCIAGSLGPGIALPAATAMNTEEGRKFGMGSTMSVYMMAMSIGMAIGPTASGAIADASGVSSAFYFVAGVALIGTIVFTWLSSNPQKSYADSISEAPSP